MKVTLGDVFAGIAAIAGGTGLLLSYRRSMADRRKSDMVAGLKRREISGSSPQHPSDENPNVGEKPAAVPSASFCIVCQEAADREKTVWSEIDALLVIAA